MCAHLFLCRGPKVVKASDSSVSCPTSEGVIGYKRIELSKFEMIKSISHKAWQKSLSVEELEYNMIR